MFAAHAQPKPALRRYVRLVVVHCSATPSGQWLSGEPGTPKHRNAIDVIDGWHKARGFARTAAFADKWNPHVRHVGYHYVIDLDGSIQMGRSLQEVGAHVVNFNASSVGICLVGGAEQNARYSRSQWTSLAALVETVCRQLSVPCMAPTYPRQGSGVCGHRDLSPDTDMNGRISPSEWLKTCPGFDVAAWIARDMQPLHEQCLEVHP